MTENRQRWRGLWATSGGAGAVDSGAKNGPGIAVLETLAGASPTLRRSAG